MKNVSRKALLIIGSLLIFVITLEGGSYLLLKLRPPYYHDYLPRQDDEIWNFEDVRRHLASDSRVGELARVIEAGKFKTRLPLYTHTSDELALKNEPPRFHGSERGRRVQREAFRVTPDLDDDFTTTGSISGKLKYKVRYTTDDIGMRQAFPGVSETTKNLVFIGCSYTFGQGLNFDETFPYIIGKKTGFRTFNKGAPGSSPVNYLKDIREFQDSYFKNIPQEETTVVLTIIPEHIQRVFHPISYLRTMSNKIDHPYVIEEQGQLKIATRFVDDFFASHHLRYYVSRLNFPVAMGLDYPVIDEEEYRLFSRILIEIQSELKQRFPHVKNFAVALFPSGSGRRPYKELRNILREEKALVLFDYIPINGAALFGPSFDLKYDGHPSVLANELYSDLLIYDLRKTFGI